MFEIIVLLSCWSLQLVLFLNSGNLKNMASDIWYPSLESEQAYNYCNQQNIAKVMLWDF